MSKAWYHDQRTSHGTRGGEWQPASGGGFFRVKPDGLGEWRSELPAGAVVRHPSRHVTRAATPPARPVTRQTLPQPGARVPILTQRPEFRARSPILSPPPVREESTRVYKVVDTATVPSATRMIAEYAVKHALTLHGVPPDAVRIQWVQRLAPGASRMHADEWYGPATMGGKTRSESHDGRQITISLLRDLPPEHAAEVGLHEGFHAVQYLRAPLAMRDPATFRQTEEQAQEFGKRHLGDLRGLLGSLRR